MRWHEVGNSKFRMKKLREHPDEGTKLAENEMGEQSTCGATADGTGQRIEADGLQFTPRG